MGLNFNRMDGRRITLKLNWYYRMMLSYTPIFFVVISTVIIVFFTTLNHQSENRYIETNRSIVAQMMKNTEVNLKLIERNSVSALLTDPHINDYFSERSKVIYDYFVIQKKLIDLKSSFPFVSSIYLYDESTKKILSDSNTYTFDSFADRQFLEKSIMQTEQTRWTESRDYTLSTIDRNGQKVVSLMKKYIYPTQQTGIIVINIYVNSMMEYLNQFSEHKQTKVHILDSSGHQFQNTSADRVSMSNFQTVSDYTGWAYSVESVNAAGYSALSLLSNIWIVFVLIIIVLALVWFTIITHIHYKPIHNLVEKINSSFGIRKAMSNSIKSRMHEFNIIESAIDNLLQKTLDYNSLQEAEATHRKRILIQELIAGQRMINRSEWQKEAAALGLPVDFDRLCAVSIEIDSYHTFSGNYKPSDQLLLKYILESAIREFASERDIALYYVWTEQHQAAVVLFLKEVHLPYDKTITEMCNDYRNWIHDNLELTASMGIGTNIEGISDISSSYRHAVSNVLLKAVFGTNCVIDQRMAQEKSDMNTYAILGAIPEMVHLWQKGEGQWRDKFIHMVSSLQKKKLGKSDLSTFATSLMQHLERELTSSSEEMAEIWRTSFQNRIETIANQTETLSELHQAIEGILDELTPHLDLQRESNSSKSIAMRMKSYIDSHFADPNLSLMGISDKFNMPTTNASILFKKETNEKFINYVTKVRLDHARKMLMDSDNAIQSIAEMVGYTHVLSFHRAFKKTYGFPPGEYREIYRAQRNV